MQVLLGLRGDYTGTIRCGTNRFYPITQPRHPAGLACSPINRCEDGLFGNLNLRMNLMPPIRELPWGKGRLLATRQSRPSPMTAYAVYTLIWRTSTHKSAAQATVHNKRSCYPVGFQRTQIFIYYTTPRRLDVPSKSDIYNIMNQLLIRGASILLFSNDVNELLSMSDEIALFTNGAVSGLLSSRDPALETKFFALLDRTVR